MKQTRHYKLTDLTASQLQQIARALTDGACAVLATDTVYGLATGAFCEGTIRHICTLKNRPSTQPFQLLLPDIDCAYELAEFSDPARRLAQAYWPGALTLILPPTPAGKPLLRGSVGLGLRVPNFAPLERLLKTVNGPLACTSANLHGQNPITTETELLASFNGNVDFMLTAGTLSPVASSVVDFTQIPPRLLREGKITTIELARTSGVSL